MAGKSLGTLTLDLLVKTASFVEGFSKAERESKKFSTNIRKEFASAANALTGLAAGATAATALLLKNAIDTAAAIDDISQVSGIAAEDLSALKYAAELEGVAFEALSTSVVRFSRAIDEANDASSAAGITFRSLGIQLRENDGTLRSTQDLLLDVADRFSVIEDGATQAAYAQQLFGRAGADLIPFLNRGREGIAELADEAERFGLIITGETAANADAFNDNLFRLQSVVKGTGVQLAETLLPTLVEFTDLIQDPATQQAIAQIVTGISNVAVTAVKAAVEITQFVIGVRDLAKFAGESLAALANGPAVDDVHRLSEELAELDSRLANITAPDFASVYSGSFGPLDQYIASLQQRREEILALLDFNASTPSDANQPSPAPAPPPPPPPPAIDPEELEAAARLQDLFNDRLESYRKEAALVGEVTELQKLRYEIENGALQGISEENAALIESYALQIDAHKEMEAAAEIRAKEAEEARRLTEQYDEMVANLQRQVDLYGDVTRAEEFLYDVASGNLSNLTTQQQAQLLALNQRLDALDEIAEAERKAAEELEKQSEKWDEFGKEAARSVQGAFADALVGVESNFSETLNRIAIEFASSEILRSIATALSGSGSGLLSKVGGFFAGAFADGGMIPAGQFGLVGEVGPEIVIGPAQVTSARKTEELLRGGGGATNINLNLPGITNSNEADRASSTILRSVRMAIEQAQRFA